MSKEGKKKFITEFKEFVAKGNALNLAIGVIIGGAFQGIVDSLVNDIIMPVLGVILEGIDFSKLGYTLVDPSTKKVLVTITYGNFISAVINFLIMALIIFLFVKLIAKITSRVKKAEVEEVAEPTTKICPYCKSEISIEATKCPHCTSDLE